MAIFVGNREDRVQTDCGHTIYFPEAGAEVYVPEDPNVQRACIDRGHLKKKEVKPAAAPKAATDK